MIDGKTILAIIPARGGSKGLKKKNIRIIGGKPLLAWTVDVAKKSKYIDRLILSSEDEKIISVAQKINCEVPFIRPDNLATDEASTIDVILHAMDSLEKKYDYVVKLQPTSPLRLPEDIDNSIESCHQQKCSACVSVTEPSKSPYWMYELTQEGFLVQLVKQENISDRRQDLPKCYVLNGAVYVAHTDWLEKEKNFITKKTCAYIMPQERSIDIDSELDLKLAELIMKYKVMGK